MPPAPAAAADADDLTRHPTQICPPPPPPQNFTSKAVLEAVGSIMTNKYSEGYPGKRCVRSCCLSWLRAASWPQAATGHQEWCE
jgi:hypothetical protein